MEIMIAIALQSGSNGNCTYVEARGKRLLLDAGISALRAERRLGAMGHDIRRVDAVIVSHDHRDHVACAGVYHRKFKLPIYISPRTLETAQDRVGLGKIGQVDSFSSGDVIKIGPLKVHTIPTPHDAADGDYSTFLRRLAQIDSHIATSSIRKISRRVTAIITGFGLIRRIQIASQT